MIPLTVTLDAAGETSAAMRRVLATLPSSFRIVAGAADVAVVMPGGDASIGTRALFVPAPGRFAPDDLEALSRDRPLMLAFHAAPRLPADSVVSLAADVPAEIVSVAVETRRVDDRGDAVAEAAQLLRRVGDPIAGLRLLAQTPEVAMLEGPLASGRIARISVRRSLRDRVTLTTASRAVRQRAVIDRGPEARGTEAWREDAGGRRTDQPVFAGGMRLSWLALETALVTGVAPDVASVLADLRLIRAAVAR